MRPVWIVVIVLVGIVVVGVLIVDLAAPNQLWDPTFDILGKVDVDFEGVTRDVVFSTCGPGVTVADRTWLIKKAHAFRYFALLNPEHEPARKKFVRELISAGGDQLLSRMEFDRLRALHADLITDEIVDNWLNLAHEAERRGERAGR